MLVLGEGTSAGREIELAELSEIPDS